jgi:opacity protein-like surface antigen
MKCFKSTTNTTRILFALALITCALSADLSRAQDGADDRTTDREHRGLFIGVNAGFGSSSFQYKESSRFIREESTHGALGGLRFGYAFSKNFALSLEGHGFGSARDEDEDWGLGAGLLTATWHPGGNGFFLRAGVGCGGGTYIHPDTGDKITIRKRAAGLFSLGYDWWLGDNTSLGLAIDGMMIDGGGATGYDDDRVGASGLTLQFNWYL